MYDWLRNLAPVLENFRIKALRLPGHEKIKTAIVCCGGGTGGVIMAAQLTALFENGLWPGIDMFFGLSVGSIISAYAALGPESLKKGTSLFFHEAVDPRHYNPLRLNSVSNMRWVIENGIKNGERRLEYEKIPFQDKDIYVALADTKHNLHFENLRIPTNRYDPFRALHAATSMQGLGNGLIDISNGHGLRYWDGATFNQLPLQQIMDEYKPTDILILSRRLPPGHKYQHGQVNSKTFALLGLGLQIRHIGYQPFFSTISKLIHKQDGWQEGLKTAETTTQANCAFLWPSQRIAIPTLTNNSQLLKIGFSLNLDRARRDIKYVLKSR